MFYVLSCYEIWLFYYSYYMQYFHGNQAALTESMRDFFSQSHIIVDIDKELKALKKSTKAGENSKILTITSKLQRDLITVLRKFTSETTSVEPIPCDGMVKQYTVSDLEDARNVSITLDRYKQIWACTAAEESMLIETMILLFSYDNRKDGNAIRHLKGKAAYIR